MLSTSPAFSMSSASHSAGSSGWLAQKTGAGPTFQWAGKVDAICRSRSNRAKRPRAGCILRIHAVVISNILCGCETWVPRRRHIRLLESFHIRRLQLILGLRWRHKATHSEIRYSAGIPCSSIASSSGWATLSECLTADCLTACLMAN